MLGTSGCPDSVPIESASRPSVSRRCPVGVPSVSRAEIGSEIDSETDSEIDIEIDSEFDSKIDSEINRVRSIE